MRSMNISLSLDIYMEEWNPMSSIKSRIDIDAHLRMRKRLTSVKEVI